MKTLIIILTTFIISSTTFSQLGLKGGLSLMNEIDNRTFWYTGGNLGFTYDISERFRGEIVIEGLFRKENFTYFSPNDITLIEEKVLISHIPITLGIDYRFLTGKIQPYAGLNIGVYSSSIRFQNQNYNYQHLTIQPKVGLNYVLTEKIMLDLMVKNYLIIPGGKSGGDILNNLGFNFGVNYAF